MMRSAPRGKFVEVEMKSRGWPSRLAAYQLYGNLTLGLLAKLRRALEGRIGEHRTVILNV